MWKFFSLSEFKCRCGRDHPNLMQSSFIDKLDALRALYGKSLYVSSGYRCPAHNDRVSSTGMHGPHTTGRAVDFKVSRQAALELVELVGYLNHLEVTKLRGKRIFTGIGVNQRGTARFIHLDDLPVNRPTIWTY